MEKVTVAETIDQSDIAKAYYAAAVDEEKRLLYVSMTRARDLLVLARGGKESDESWIKTIGAEWLQGDADATELTLPSGEKIPYQDWILEPLDGASSHQAEVVPIYWFKALEAAGCEKLPLKFTPSSVEQQDCTILESIVLGNRMTIQQSVDMAQLGTAIHGCIGASFTDTNSQLSEEEVDAVFHRMGISNVVKSHELLGQIAAFKSWIKSRWPEATSFAEIPTEMKMPNCQVLQGRIDLLLKVKDGWILIDHKSNPGGSDRWESVANENAGQLAAYRNAVEQASGEKVLESWLFLPVAAVVISLK